MRDHFLSYDLKSNEKTFLLAHGRVGVQCNLVKFNLRLKNKLLLTNQKRFLTVETAC